MTQTLTLKHGDCVEVLAEIAEGSIGSVICDPPYGLSFMGKDFDKLGKGESQQVWHREWLDQAYKVLQSGGVIKAFSGTRTFHRLAAAMEDAGFTDIRLEAWTYGSGFPKSLNVSKAIDSLKLNGRTDSVGLKETNHQRPGDGRVRSNTINNGHENWVGAVESACEKITNDTPATEEGSVWNGWGTALKPAWEPILVGRKP